MRSDQAALPDGPVARGWLPPVQQLAVVAALLVLSTWCWVELQQIAGVSADIWLSSGLMLAVLLWAPRRHGPAFQCVGVLAGIAAKIALGSPSLVSIALSLVNAIEVGTAAWYLRRQLGSAPDLSSFAAFQRFAWIAVGIAPLAAAAADAALLQALLGTPWRPVLYNRFLADAVGMGTVTPLALCALRGELAALALPGRRLRATAGLAAFCAVLAGVFVQTRYPLLFLVPGALLLLVNDLGFPGLTVATPMLAAFALVATALGHGPLAANAAMPMPERVLLEHIFVLTATLLGFGIAGADSDRRRISAALRAERDLLTEREAALRESEAQLRLITAKASDTIFRIAADGSVSHISEAGAELFGIPTDRLRRGHAWQMVQPADLPSLEDLHRRLIAGILDRETMAFRVDTPHRGERWVEIHSRSVRDPVTGAPDGYISVARDITKRRLGEEALRLSEARLRAYFTSLADGVVVCSLDEQGEVRCTAINPAAAYLLDLPTTMPGNIRLQRLLPAGYMARLASRVGRCQVSGHALQDTEEITTSRGQRSLQVAITPVVDDCGEVREFLECLRDVTVERRLAEERAAHQAALERSNGKLSRLARHLARARDQAQQASSAKSRFLAAMSHELRTPLNGILGYTHLLQIEGGLSLKQSTRLAGMLEAGRHLLETINQVLEFSEIEAGRTELHTRQTELRGLARASLDLVRPAAEAKGVMLDLALAEDLPDSLMTDPARLRQMLVNLLGNAVKFTDAGYVALRLARLTEDRLRIEVTDTGPGIAEDKRPLLGQDFERLGVETKEGAGLGLALTTRLASLMGGALSYEANPGGGSIFALDLPLTCADSTADPSAGVIAPMGALRVLLVDDAAMNREIARAILQSGGHHVTEAVGGAEAVAAATAELFDVVLMDVRMPGMDGLQASRLIRALPGANGQVPIVALTAQAFADQVRQCKQAGMVDHLLKPFAPAALLDAVERQMPRRGLPPAAPLAVQVFEEATFAGMAELLGPSEVQRHLESLMERCRAVFEDLQALHDAHNPDALCAQCHLLAGTAGMFGFARLSVDARMLEQSLETGQPDRDQKVAALRTTITASCDRLEELALIRA